MADIPQSDMSVETMTTLINAANQIVMPISTIGLLAVVIIFSCTPFKLRTMSGVCMVHLSGCLMVQNIFLMMVFNVTRSQLGGGGCATLAIITHFMILSVFSWSVIVCYQTIRAFCTKSNEVLLVSWPRLGRIFICAYLPSLGIILLCIISSFCESCFLNRDGSPSVKVYYAPASSEFCWLASGDSTLYGMTIPAGVLMFATLILYICTIVVVIINIYRNKSFASQSDTTTTAITQPISTIAINTTKDDSNNATESLDHNESSSHVDDADSQKVLYSLDKEEEDIQNAMAVQRRQRPGLLALLVVMNIGVLICLVWLLPFIGIWIRSYILAVISQYLLAGQGLAIAITMIAQMISCHKCRDKLQCL